MRHRTPRLAAFLALVVFLLAVFRGTGDAAVGSLRTTLLAAGTLTAAAAARLLAPGPALAAARLAAAPGWFTPLGRLTGALFITLPFAWVVAIGTQAAPPSPGPALRIGLIATLQVAALASVVLAVTPAIGASGGAAVGLMMAWLGLALPSTVAGLLHDWPLVQRPAVFAWNVLPLGWRAVRWLDHGAMVDFVVPWVWIGLAVPASAWTSLAVHYEGRIGPEGSGDRMP